MDVWEIFFLLLCFYLLWKPCNIFINCQFCVDKDAWSLKQQKNIIYSIKSLNIYLNLSCNRFIFGVFVNTWTVVRKVVPNRGSLSALLFPWKFESGSLGHLPVSGQFVKFETMWHIIDLLLILNLSKILHNTKAHVGRTVSQYLGPLLIIRLWHKMFPHLGIHWHVKK